MKANKILTSEQIIACRERINNLKKDDKWPATKWFNDEDFEIALNTIENFKVENDCLKNKIQIVVRKGEKMKEIKFRAWDKKEKCMLDWCYLCQTAYNCRSVFDQHNATEIFSSLMYDVLTNYDENFILMLDTGLHDKNGLTVYEGDVVEIIGNIYENPELNRYER